jgi:glycosyltransferase involved in cell wall biosynthesis
MDTGTLRIIISMVDHPDQMSGAVRLAFDEALYLKDLGHDVWLVSPDTSRSHPQLSRVQGLHVLCYTQPNVGALSARRIKIHQNQTKLLLANHIQGTVDVIHGHALLQYDGMASLYKIGARRCYSVHSPVQLEIQAGGRGSSLSKRLRLSLAGRLLNRVESRCLAVSDCVTCDSEYTRSLLRSFHGDQTAQNTLVIPGWVDVERFRIVAERQLLKEPLNWPTDAPVLFTLRRLVPRMGLDKLLLALRQVKSAGLRFRFIIGGAGPLRAQLESMAERLDLNDCVSFTGFISEDMLPAMYAAADAFVLPTTALECFGLIVLEALACGRPVLATPVGAIPEILNQIEPQWLARDADVASIAELLIAFLQDYLPSHEPTCLRNWVVQNFSRNQILQKLVSQVLGTGWVVPKRAPTGW